MYRTIRLYGSKIINIVRLSSFLRIRTLCVLFIQLIRDFFYFHFKECCFFENQKIDSIRRWMDEHYCDMVPATFPSLQEKSNNDPVWIFWYQGETAMPEIVKICYNSIVSNIHDRRGGHHRCECGGYKKYSPVFDRGRDSGPNYKIMTA